MIRYTDSGFFVHSETGEILGHERTHRRSEGEANVLIEHVLPYRVVDDRSAEWVMEKYQEASAELLALEARQKALTAQIDRMKAKVKVRVNWLDYRFKADLEQFIRTKLENSRSGFVRSWDCPFGRMGLRAVKGGLKLRTDITRAEMVQWVKSYFPGHIVVTEDFNAAELKKVAATCKMPKENGEVVSIFEAVPESETFYINTGVKDR